MAKDPRVKKAIKKAKARRAIGWAIKDAVETRQRGEAAGKVGKSIKKKGVLMEESAMKRKKKLK